MYRSKTIAITMIMACACAARLNAQAPILPEPDAIAAIESIGGRVYRTSDGVVDIIDMKGSKVRDDHLVLLQSLPTVRVLNLDGSQVSDAGVEQLLKLPNLEEVSFRRTAVSPATATALKDRHPKVYSVQVDRKGLRFQRLAVLVFLLPMGFYGIWLIRVTRKKRSVLSPRLYVRGVLCGVLLAISAVLFLMIAIVQTLGFDFHLSDLFG